MVHNETYNHRIRGATRLLYGLQNKGIKAVIAGGFIRDAFFDRPYRDIDVYVSDRDYGEAHQFLFGNDISDEHEHFGEGQAEYEHQSIQVHREAFVHSSLTAEYPELQLETHKIDLIGLRWDSTVKCEVDAREIISRFNIGLNQCAVYLDRQIVSCFTNNFLCDKTDKTITVLREDWGQRATTIGVQKILKKYPDYRAQFKDGRDFDWDVT